MLAQLKSLVIDLEILALNGRMTRRKQEMCSVNDQTQGHRKVMRWPEHCRNIVRKNEMSSRLVIGQIKSNRLPMILQSLAPAMLYVPTPTMNYITVCDKVSMPPNGGTTMRFMRPRALTPPTVQLGNSGIDPPAQIPQRDIIDAQMAFFGGYASAEKVDYDLRLAA